MSKSSYGYGWIWRHWAWCCMYDAAPQNQGLSLSVSPKPPFGFKGKIKLQLHTFLPMMSWKCMLTAWSTDCSASKVINPKPSQRPRVNQGSRGVVTTQDEEQYWASAEWGSVKTELEAPGVRMMLQTCKTTQLGDWGKLRTKPWLERKGVDFLFSKLTNTGLFKWEIRNDRRSIWCHVKCHVQRSIESPTLYETKHVATW